MLGWSTAYRMQGRGVEGASAWGDYFLARGVEATGGKGDFKGTRVPRSERR